MTRLAIMALSAVLVPSLAVANPVKSIYSTIELKACRLIKKHPDGGAWLCKGAEGIPVYVAEGDLRTFVSAGVGAQTQPAATQTLKAFNSIFRGKSGRATLEWRVDRKGGRAVPYATILRHFTSGGDDKMKGQVLVVSRINGGQSCHVAYVDALANPNAIALARSAADELARKFDCKTQPTIIGAQGRSPM